MSRTSFTHLLARSIRPASVPARSLHLSAPRLASNTAGAGDKPDLSQGHATKKAEDPAHKDYDVQSASVRAGKDAKAKSGPDDAGEPFDAARQGSTGGGKKKGQDGKTGAFMDQVGGQDERTKGKGVVMGGKEKAPAAGMVEKIQEAVGYDGLRKTTKKYHTSATQSRSFSSLSTVGKNAPAAGYAKAHKRESEGDHPTPPEALPQTLKSPYQEVDPAAVQPASPDALPSSKTDYSSSAQDPAHETLAKQAKTGQLADRNPPPSGDQGPKGLDEAWKDRKI